ncbi:hypothetical protein NY2A_b304R [Paramecium bursaria Chlorella virus NY2A]|uniref:Uncharacterized protein b304R n=1 Tax=Paramecium bursaria Chlorella virus NY2A TaxID=46021 RepID=A7IWH9_PBCVN|nr:hypothetical protein NY2A_b304R [Paramecium bursaria Chlorella virus NY2A]ABT14703.1 hypothetical protein NY2A_b304R [Paramecium bursaria Chlorella virus NY2A]
MRDYFAARFDTIKFHREIVDDFLTDELRDAIVLAKKVLFESLDGMNARFEWEHTILDVHVRTIGNVLTEMTNVVHRFIL